MTRRPLPQTRSQTRSQTLAPRAPHPSWHRAMAGEGALDQARAPISPAEFWALLDGQGRG